jgi:prephenate dehydrogenase
MGSNIAIIGLGQIGTSIGLALKETAGGANLVGSDRNPAAARAAEMLGAIDKVTGMKEAVRDAELVILCVPLSAVREVIRTIGPALKDGAVLLETAPVKRQVPEWVRESLSPGRYYVGIVPAITPDAIGGTESGARAARADLFKRTVMVVDAPRGTPPEVEQLAINLARLLGAKPLLADPLESDGLMTTAHLLPQLAAAALLQASIDRPGWLEARKLAGRPFAAVTGGLAYYDDPASLQLAAMGNPEVVVHALDTMIAALKGMRDEIQGGDQESLGERLMDSYQARERWLDERGAADWLKEGGDAVDLPQLGEQVMQMLFGGRIVDRMKGQSPGVPGASASAHKKKSRAE